MFNRSQNKAFNQLVSASDSHISKSQGNDVAVFRAERNLVDALTECGFTQDIRKDKFNNFYGHTMWWNESAHLLVLSGHNGTWTIATENHTLTCSDLAQHA